MSPSAVLSGVTFTPQGGVIRRWEQGKGHTTIGEGGDWVRVVSSAYYVHNPAGGGSGSAVWLARVENIGPSTLCSVQVNPTFFDAQGEQLPEYLTDGYVYAPNFFVAHGAAACIQPGQYGSARAIDGQAVLDVSRIAEVRFSASGVTYADVLLNDRVVLSDVLANDNAVRATLTNVSAYPIERWSAYVFAYDESGGIVAAQHLTEHTEDIPAGHVWSFQTEPFSVPTSSHDVFFQMGY